MTRVALILFSLSVLWLAYSYAGYMVFLWLAGFFRRFRHETREGYFPSVSVLISARNEEKDIAWKVSETLSWNYPADQLELIVASDASDDGTDEILRSVTDPRLRYIRIENRSGKNEAINRLASIARGEVLFFTDANTHIGPNCLRSMARHFADARVGCVTGMEKTLAEGEDPVVTTGTRNYLEYEFLITRLESRLGSVLVCDGSIFCIRRELYVPVIPELANDLELPIHIGGRGYAVLCEPSARSLERATQSPREEFNRKRRICAQGALGLWRLRGSIHGLRRWQFVSRKLLRWLALIPIAVLLLSSAFLAARPVFLALLLLQLTAYAVACLAMVQEARGARVSLVLAIPYYFMLVHTAAILGVFESLLGKRFSVWEIASQSRGPNAQGAGAEKI